MGSSSCNSARDQENEIDLCLEDPLDDKGSWSLFLRFAEISDLGNARLRALTAASVTVSTESSLAEYLADGPAAGGWKRPPCGGLPT